MAEEKEENISEGELEKDLNEEENIDSIATQLSNEELIEERNEIEEFGEEDDNDEESIEKKNKKESEENVDDISAHLSDEEVEDIERNKEDDKFEESEEESGRGEEIEEIGENEEQDTVEEILDKKVKTKKDLVFEMRALLINYPLNIQFSNNRDMSSICMNLITIVDLLNYCKYKTTKSDILELIESELKDIQSKVNFKRLNVLYYDLINRFIEYGKEDILDEIHRLLDSKIPIVNEKIQLYLLSIPTRGKRNMHLQFAHGIMAHGAEEYMGSEEKEGEKVTPDTAFKIGNEGEVIPIND